MEPKKIKRSGFLIGDCSFITRDHYSQAITEADAQAMSDILCSTFNIRPYYKVCYIDSGRKKGTGRKFTSTRTFHHGEISHGDRKIWVYRPSDGIIIHELAHALDRKSRAASRHDKAFRDCQRKLFNAWHGTEF